MTAPSITLQGTATPGRVSRRKILAKADRTPTIAVYKFSSGNSNYTTGGEDLSAIWNEFRDVRAIIPSQVTATVAARREFSVVLSTKKLIIFSAANTQNAASSLAAVTDDVRLVVYGYR